MQFLTRHVSVILNDEIAGAIASEPTANWLKVTRSDYESNLTACTIYQAE